MFAIDKKVSVVAKHPHSLKNLTGETVTVEPNERVNLLSLRCALGNTYYAIQKKAKGLIILPISLFKTFNTFKEGV